MDIITFSDCVVCSFNDSIINEKEHNSSGVEVFFAEIKNIGSRYSYLKNFASEDELSVASRFNSELYRRNYISCHALLRLILARRLDMKPFDLTFNKGKDNKPGLSCNSAYFNITHTAEAFAFAIVKDSHVGIDLERIKPGIKIHAVIEKYFSNEEKKFIFGSDGDAMNRFFLLWTRKEAFLKALGTGIVDNLNQITVSEPVNNIKKELFHGKVQDFLLAEYFLYSMKREEYFLSLATPKKSAIVFYDLNEANIINYLDF